MRTRLIQPFTSVLSDPMLRNGYALIASATVTQVLGVGYWIVAARTAPAAVVGRNSAAIYMMLFLAGVAELNLMSTLVRFLPTSGRRAARFIVSIYAVSAAVAAVIALGFLLVVPIVEPQLGFLRASPFLASWFVVSVITGAIFVLQDSALTGVRAAPFVPLENTTFSLLKLAMLFPLVGLLPQSGIYISWTAAIALAVIPTNIYLFGRAVPRHLKLRSSSVRTSPIRFGEIRDYAVPDFVAAFLLLASMAVLPLLIIDRLGPAAAGHYALAWVIGYSLYLVSMNMGSSLVVETAADQSEVRDRALRSITHLAKLLVPVVVLLIAAAPYVLAVFGPGYARADVTPLRLLVLAALPALITNTATSATRSLRRMRIVLAIQICICAPLCVLSVLLIGPLGITGVAAAWLIAQTATAAALAAGWRFWLPPRRVPRHARAARRYPGDGAVRDVRWDGQVARVTTPVPTDIWEAVAGADPSAMPFHTPVWRDCVCSVGGWEDASRLYELPGGRQLVLMMARRSALPSRLTVEASWPHGWGQGGVLAPGGVRPEEVAFICADIASRGTLSTSLRPGFPVAPAWSAVGRCSFTIPRAVHVAHFDGSFEDFWRGSVKAKKQGSIRNARRHLDRAGIVITSGNSPELVDAFYQVYLRWIEWRARQRKEPLALARWHGQRAEPLAKFENVASRLAPGCRIWVAWRGEDPIAANMSLFAGDAAVGWRAFTDRSMPARFRLAEVLAVEVLRYACESGCRYVDMGESVGSSNLAGVKARLGGQEHSCDEYCFEHLPLSPGRVAFQTLRSQAEDWLMAAGRRAGLRQTRRKL
jgi:O-antigen/teichoic acid export membrane protein